MTVHVHRVAPGKHVQPAFVDGQGLRIQIHALVFGEGDGLAQKDVRERSESFGPV